MTVDEAISWLLSIADHEGEDIPIYDTDVEAIKMGIDTMRKYQQLQADYETRLKADMVAMLEELKKEIVEIAIPKATVSNEIFWNMGADTMKKEVGTRIQQKINSLKEN